MPGVIHPPFLTGRSVYALRLAESQRKEVTHMAREDMIRQDMQLVGTYNAIFEPTIKQLAKTERELSRAEKEW